VAHSLTPCAEGVTIGQQNRLVSWAHIYFGQNVSFTLADHRPLSIKTISPSMQKNKNGSALTAIANLSHDGSNPANSTGQAERN
jgi:hypothetical protein